ncbi:UNVERIFIED_CONTAM: hypothetical protein FKN15_069159 [Acipenser sinensis]
MIHLLRWSPVLVSGGSVRYTVEFQGEHEREYRNGMWQEVLECLDIVHPVCNVTADISSNVDYDLRVRAYQEERVSPWTSIKNMFNRHDTILTVPVFNVTARKEFLQVDFKEMPKSIVFVLKYWPKGVEHQAVQVTSEQNPFVLVQIEEGVTYCLQAWTHVEVIHKSSNVSELQCVSIPSTLPPWVAPTAVTVSLIVVIVVSLFLLVALQKHLHLIKYFCCPKEMLPDSLLQGKEHLVYQLYDNIKAFEQKLQLLERQLKACNLVHFSSIKEVDTGTNSAAREYADLLQEFQSRFSDFSVRENDFSLFSHPFSCIVDYVPEELQMQLIELQCDSVLKEKYSTVPLQDFYKYADSDKYPAIRKHAQRMFSLFESTYICEQTFSLMKLNKSRLPLAGCVALVRKPTETRRGENHEVEGTVSYISLTCMYHY